MYEPRSRSQSHTMFPMRDCGTRATRVGRAFCTQVPAGPSALSSPQNPSLIHPNLFFVTQGDGKRANRVKLAMCAGRTNNYRFSDFQGCSLHPKPPSISATLPTLTFLVNLYFRFAREQPLVLPGLPTRAALFPYVAQSPPSRQHRCRGDQSKEKSDSNPHRAARSENREKEQRGKAIRFRD